jgi:hypothetical protein
VRYRGRKEKLTAKLVDDVVAGSRVFDGSFSSRWERLLTVTAPIAVGDAPSMKAEATGTVVKITATTLWIGIGSVHAAEYKHEQVVKLRLFAPSGQSVDRGPTSRERTRAV